MNWVAAQTAVISWYILRTHVTMWHRDIRWHVTCRDSPRPWQEVTWTSYRTWYHLSDMNVERGIFYQFHLQKAIQPYTREKNILTDVVIWDYFYTVLVKLKPKPRELSLSSMLRWWPGLLWALVTWDWPMMGDKSTETTQCHHQGGPCQPGKLVCTLRESIEKARELYLNF